MSKSARVAAARSKLQEHKSTLPPLESERLDPLPIAEPSVVEGAEAGGGEGDPSGDGIVDFSVSDSHPGMQPEPAVGETAAAPAETESKTSVAPATTTLRSGAKYSDAAIVWVMRTNPKRPGTAGWDRFARYQSGVTTVASYKADRKVGKFAAADLAWDLKRGFIALQEPGAPEPTGHVAAKVADAPVETVESSAEASEG